MNKYFLLSSTFMLLTYGIAHASDNSLEVNLGTHTHLPQIQLNSLSLNPNGSYKTARVCSLTNENCDDAFGFNKSEAETNSGAQKCKNAGYNITACPDPKLLDGQCKNHPSYFKSCICPASVTLSNTEYCTKFCDGKCVSKSLCPTNQIHNSALTGCYQPSCSEGGYSASVPSNNKCSSVSYYGRTCYSGCYQPQCSEGGYSASTPSNNKCSSTSYYGRTCYYGCYQPQCSEGGYLSYEPAGQTCSYTTYYGRGCYYSCRNNTPPPPPTYSRTSIDTVWDHGACFLKCSYTGGNYHISQGCWHRQDFCNMAKDDPNSSGRCPSTLSSFSHGYNCGYFRRQSITTVWNNGECFLKCTYADTNDGEIKEHISTGCWSRQDFCDMAKNDPDAKANRCPTNMTYPDFNSSYACI